MEEAGSEVKAHDVNNLATVKTKNQVSGGLQSCHTAIVDGYVIEGHVPAEDVSELLVQRPDVAGLAVPGMPVGSPGMKCRAMPDSRLMLLRLMLMAMWKSLPATTSDDSQKEQIRFTFPSQLAIILESGESVKAQRSDRPVAAQCEVNPGGNLHS